jgi:hypothetical protein
LEQLADPEAATYVPVAQLEQVADPVLGWYWPAEQLVQKLTAAADFVPVAQLKHELESVDPVAGL